MKVAEVTTELLAERAATEAAERAATEAKSANLRDLEEHCAREEAAEKAKKAEVDAEAARDAVEKDAADASMKAKVDAEVARQTAEEDESEAKFNKIQQEEDVARERARLAHRRKASLDAAAVAETEAAAVRKNRPQHECDAASAYAAKVQKSVQKTWKYADAEVVATAAGERFTADAYRNLGADQARSDVDAVTDRQKMVAAANIQLREERAAGCQKKKKA